MDYRRKDRQETHPAIGVGKMRLLGIEAVQTALTVPFGNHRCEEVSQIEPVDDFYDAGDRRIQGYLWVPKASSEDVEKPALKGIVLFAHVSKQIAERG